MLIEFSASNFRSVKNEQTLSLAMTKREGLEDSNTFTSNLSKPAKLLKTAVLYGPNASGKTNFFTAVMTMRRIVLSSATEGQRGDELPVTPFRLDEITEELPSGFEIVFIDTGILYQYGFSASRDKVMEEWLFAFPKNRPQRWFTRTWIEEKQNYKWDMGNSLSGQKQLWQEATRANALFLSTAVQLNSEQLQPVFDWFKYNLRGSSMDMEYPKFTATLCKDSDSRKIVLNYLKVADLGIDDVSVEAERKSAARFPEYMPEEVKKFLLEHMDDDLFNIKTIHKSNQGKAVPFDFEEESEGTKKFFGLTGPIIDTLQNGNALFVDELHSNFHPMMVRFLLDIFHNRETNPNNAQLIFTSHETSILSQDIFRRDQIWFCEKDKEQASIIYPLTDFSPRKDREDIEARYLSGRYGALPFINKAGLLQQ